MYLNEIEDPKKKTELLWRAAERLRRHSLVSTDKAGSGHPTSCLSCAELMSVLFFEQMRIDSSEPDNLHNDRFVLSKGHAAPILWAVYYEAGLIEKDELESLRKIDSAQEGHPTPRNKWIDVATGSLGQGLSMALGMAWAARAHGTENHIYTLLGDGETAEGSVWEAAALAAHRKMGNLTAIIDINRLGQSDPTMLEHDLETYRGRFEAFGWQVIEIDGHDIQSVSDALRFSHRPSDCPTVILAATTKGRCVSDIEGEKGSHGKPVKSLEDALAELDQDALANERELGIHEVDKSETTGSIKIPGELPPGEYEKGDSVATRQAFGDALLELGAGMQQLVALDGDVKNSTKLQPFFDRYPERGIECYIAEQNMLGMAIGISQSGFLPCAATFAAFLTRAFDQLRMASISRSRLIVAGTHAGVSIGQDGPSQMGLEDLAMMRSLNGSVVLYPSDGPSTRAALHQALLHEGITYLRLTRGDTPVIYDAEEKFETGKAKVVASSESDTVTLIGGGVTLHECVEARKQLVERGISARVVDCFSIKPIDAETINRCVEETGALVVVEDHYEQGGIGEAVLSALEGRPCAWRHLAVRDLPRSGAPNALLDQHGISAKHIVEAAEAIAEKG